MDNDETKRAKLESMRNRATLYEMAMIRGDVRILIRYSNRKGRRSILKNVYDFADKIEAITGTNEIVWGATQADGATCGEWTIKFTGRTRREAVIVGEFPFIRDYVKP